MVYEREVRVLKHPSRPQIQHHHGPQRGVGSTGLGMREERT